MPGHKKSHKYKASSTALIQAVAGMVLTTPPQSATSASDAGGSSAAPATASTCQPATAPAATQASPAGTRVAHRGADPGTSSTAPATAPAITNSTPTCTATAAPSPAAAASISVAATPTVPAASVSTHPTPAATESDQNTNTPVPITWEQVQAIRAVKGLDNIDTLLAYQLYTEQLVAAGQRDKAITVLQPVLKEAMSTLPVDHCSTISISHQLATHLTNERQYEAAARHWKWLLPRISIITGACSDRFTTAVSCLAVCLAATGQHGEALPMAQQAYTLCIQHHGHTHPQTIGVLESYLFSAMRTRSLLPQAVLDHAEECLHSLGGVSIENMQLAQSLCSAYSLCGQHQQAAKHLTQLVAAAKQLYGEGSPMHLEMLRGRAMNAADRKQHAQAASLFQSLLHTTKSKLGERHKDVVKCAYDLGHVFVLANRQQDALQVFEHVWPTAKAVLGPRDELSISLLVDFFLTLHSLGREKQARALAQDATAWGVTEEEVRAQEARIKIKPVS